MNSKRNNITSFIALIVFLAISICLPLKIHALSIDTYATESALKDGRWVKISVSETGMHLISNSNLQKWGFSDPSKVHVYGYGGKRLPDLLNSSYIDDLPLTPSVRTSQGLLFYAQGPVTWNRASRPYTHSINPFSTVGYYFLSDKEIEATEIPTYGSGTTSDECATTFIESIYHEKDLYSPGATGHLLLGEDFKYNASQNFNFTLTDKVETAISLRYSFVTKTHNSSSYVTVSANGEKSLNSDIIKPTNNDTYSFGTEGRFHKNFDISGDRLTLNLAYKSSVTIHLARLNYISLNYTRAIKLHNGKLTFNSSNTHVSLSDANANTHVWDVTNPLTIFALNTTLEGNTLKWVNDYSGLREYVAWNENGTFPEPTFVANVSNQNLHAEETPNMVIFTISDWQAQAERIADLHRNSADSLKVLVVTQDKVFNEFSSGVPDVNAFRKMLKMFWDRGNADVNSPKLKYALLFGRGTYDNRHLTSTVASLGYTTMPMWQSEGGLNDNDSFSSDDIISYLEDNSGANISGNKMSIAIGRIPVRSSSEAKKVVDKLYGYVNNSIKDSWKNQVLFIADDQDNGTHMKQTETMYTILKNSESGSQFFYNKIYLDAYVLENGEYPSARAQMLQKLDEGVVWWSYIGHANTTSWSHEKFFTYNDISNLYIRRLPVLYAATCEFMRWDADALSGAEILFQNPDGGSIAVISAVRPVYISNNGVLSSSLAKNILNRDSNGNYLPIGEILRLAKNAMLSDENKLRFGLMGDPAMRFATPPSTIELEQINNQLITYNNQPELKARQEVTLKGSLYNPQGEKMSNFNGIFTATMYDAEKNTTSNGYGEGEKISFDEPGGKLYIGRDSIINGEFEMKVSMPSEISNENYHPATLNMYAYDNNLEAVGCNRNFYIWGYDETAADDNEPPVISAYFLNHESFKQGDNVNESPMVIANISDNKGINISSAGIGHQMVLTLDGTKTFTNVSQYYTPGASEECASGSIAYPISNLSEGNHSLRLRIWDTSGNVAEETIEFFVQNGLAPTIYDVYSDANPATTEANFYITNNRPDAKATITISVYNLMGKLEWTATQSGRNDMLRSFPVTWDLRDMAGRRVPRGIYIYKAEITTDDKHYATESKKLAVAAQ